MREILPRGDLSISIRHGLGVASIAARKGIGAADVGAALGLAAPDTPRSASEGGLSLLGYGPSVWLAVQEEAPADWDLRIEQRLGRLASVSDQSGAYIFYRFKGDAARTLLSRGAFIDIDPSAFPLGAVASTVIAHLSALIWARAPDTYDVAIFRSYEASFRHWIATAAGGLDHGAR